MNTTPFPIRPVLLVDDEEQFLFSISLVLEAAGINHVVQCQDSRDVMPLLSKEDFSPRAAGYADASAIGRRSTAHDFGRFPGTPRNCPHGREPRGNCGRMYEKWRLRLRRETCGHSSPRGGGAACGGSQRPASEKSSTQGASVFQQPGTARSVFRDCHPRPGDVLDFRQVESIAETGNPVLITGETGVGKEKIAEAIHQLRACLKKKKVV